MWDEIRYQMKRLNELPFVSGVLVAVNVIVFLICTFTGDLLYNKGSMSAIDLIGGEYYRLFTSMFLHADSVHLVNNMLLLFGLGLMLEKTLGHLRFAVYYFVTGVCGHFLSVYTELAKGEYYDSIGASGAVFGMVGVLLILTFFYGKELENVTPARVILMVLLSFYDGFKTEYVNNEAHFGGLLSGCILAIIFCVIHRIRERRKQKAQGRTEDKNEY